MTNFVSTHWGTYETSKNNQNNIKINKWSKDPNPSDFGLGFLDAATSEKVVDLLFELNKEAGTTLVIVTHDMELAKKNKRILRLQGGKIMKDHSIL